LRFVTEFQGVPLQVNKKTRNRAYEILVEIAHAFGDEERGGNRENLNNFFQMVNIQFKVVFLFSLVN